MDFQCKYCNKTFDREYIWVRHQTRQCKKKPKKEVELPNFRELIKNSETIIKNKHDHTEPAVVNNKDMIMLKNLNKWFEFKCKFCNEGFEYESQRLQHQTTCFHRPPTEIEHDKSEIQQLKDTVKQLRFELSHLQDKVSILREKTNLVDDVRQELLNLKDIAFHLKLFKYHAIE